MLLLCHAVITFLLIFAYCFHSYDAELDIGSSSNKSDFIDTCVPDSDTNACINRDIDTIEDGAKAISNSKKLTPNEDDTRELLNSISEGLIDHIKVLLETYEFNLNNIFDKDGNNLVIISSMQGNLEILKLLAEDSIDIFTTGQNGWTAFHFACYYGHVEVVKFLASIDIDVIHAIDKTESKGIHYAAYGGHKIIVKYILKLDKDSLYATNKWGWTPIHSAAMGGKIKIIKYLLSIDINLLNSITSMNNDTPLILASITGKTDVVKLLLTYDDIDINIVTKDGKSALNYAEEKNFPDIINLLRK